MKNDKKAFRPDHIMDYFRKEWAVLLAVTISGLIYNLGLLAGPWFEGRMTGCLVEILNESKGFADMLVLVLMVCGSHCGSADLPVCETILGAAILPIM